MVGCFNAVKVSEIKLYYVAMEKKDDKTKHKGVVKSMSSKKINGSLFFGITLTTKKIQIKTQQTNLKIKRN